MAVNFFIVIPIRGFLHTCVIYNRVFLHLIPSEKETEECEANLWGEPLSSQALREVEMVETRLQNTGAIVPYNPPSVEDTMISRIRDNPRRSEARRQSIYVYDSPIPRRPPVGNYMAGAQIKSSTYHRMNLEQQKHFGAFLDSKE